MGSAAEARRRRYRRAFAGIFPPHACLPTERDLLRAMADRSAMAIDRARMTDALREREMRIAELSGHLMHAQEEERKRISRELHDEQGRP